MKYDADAPTDRLRSEGKILEITPVLYMPEGTLLSLPPTTYLCPNWLLGYQDYHIQGYPFILHLNERTSIPGTNTSYGPMLGFMARVYENSPGMALGGIPEISAEWIQMFAELTQVGLAQRVTELERQLVPPCSYCGESHIGEPRHEGP